MFNEYVLRNTSDMNSFCEITSENFLSICRCCIMNKGDIDIFEAHMEDLSLSNIIFICTNEMIEKHDGLSRVICNICMQILINSYAFIKTFKHSQNSIKTMYKVFENIDSVNKKAIDSNKVMLEEYDNKSKTINATYELLGENLSQGEEHGHIENQKCIDQKCDLKIIESLERSIAFSEGHTFDVISDAKQLPDEDQCLDHISEASHVELSAQEARETPRNEGVRKPNKRIEVDPTLISGLDLQCFQCLSVFSSKAEMFRHHKATNHTMAPNYKCGICSKAISKRKAYWDHMAMHRHSKKKAVCEVCGAIVVSLHLKRHMLVHQEKTHMCQYCGKGYVQKNTLTDHVKRKHEGQDKNLNTLCFICGKLCNDLKHLTTHLNTHTKEKLNSLSHCCEDCGKYFLNAQSLSTHIYMAHKITDRLPKHHKRSITNQQRLKILSEGERKTNKQSHKKINIERRKNIPKREPKECPICHRKICYLGFNRHLTTHSGVKPHQCKHCSKSFRLFSSLKSHMYVHLDLKPFKCDICNQEFRHYTTLKVHKRMHTGEKPYNCHMCNKRFRSASGLKRHQNQRKHKINLEENKEKSPIELDKSDS